MKKIILALLTASIIISSCDILDKYPHDAVSRDSVSEEDLEQVFACVNNYLDPEGIFIFDLKTIHYFRDVCGDCVLADSREEGSFIWENNWYEEEQMNEYDLTLFIREASGLYRREQELHDQRGYEITAVCQALERAGMRFVTVLDADTMQEPTDFSERIYVVAREHGKKKGTEHV